MELYTGVYRIQSLFGDRNLFQYLFVGDNVVRVDTGIAVTPEKAIFPYMDSLKLKPERLRLALTTHPGIDHQGGNHAIKRISPGTWLACGEADRPLVEDTRRLYDVRYNFLRAEHDVGFEAEPVPEAGMARKMAACLSGGARLSLKCLSWRIRLRTAPEAIAPWRTWTQVPHEVPARAVA
jgi:glyoxylase-like metal-dependent hydrolase (beta-lactamase superfamily II)